MRPSSPAGVGRIGDALVFLLPGNPVSCLCAYDFFAGRAIRLRGGLPARLAAPHACARCVARKIVSAIGRVDYCRVRLVDGEVEPIALSGASILSSTTRADGFVIVPARERRLRPRHRSHRVPLRLISATPMSKHAAKAAAADAGQTQFLDVITRDEATARFREHLRLAPLGNETRAARRRRCDRVLARRRRRRTSTCRASIAPTSTASRCRPSDTFGAMEETAAHACSSTTKCWRPASCRPRRSCAGRATPIATGGMLPRGADAVLMVEHSEVVEADGATDGDPARRSPPART